MKHIDTPLIIVYNEWYKIHVQFIMIYLQVKANTGVQGTSCMSGMYLCVPAQKV